MAAAYDDYDYPSYWENRSYEHASEVTAIGRFFEQIGDNKSVLDIGAGYGRLAKVYDKFSKRITLVDPSSEILKKAKVYLNGACKKTNFVRSTLQNLGDKIKKEKYDVVVLVRVMHHIKDPALAIKIASRYLPRGGYIILEFANKMHGKAIVTNFLNGNFTFPLDISPIDKRSKKNIRRHSILFLNHHPDVIEKCLDDNGFRIVNRLSVSNIRSCFVKERVPLAILTALENYIQKPLARINFGPSIFILAQKKGK